MRGASIRERMPVDSDRVFELLHDYTRRLEWDTLLRKAVLTRGFTEPGVGATSLCVGRPFFGWFGLETRYLVFQRGKVAAVALINRPPLFAKFAASIRHEDSSEGSSLTYTFRFAARPRILRWLIEPLMLMALRLETRKRLKALASFLESDDPHGER